MKRFGLLRLNYVSYNSPVKLISASILSTYLRRENGVRFQLFRNSEQLPLTEKIIIQFMSFYFIR